MQKDIPQSVDPDEPKTPGRAIFSGAHDYFVNNVLPDTIQAHVSRYQTPTSYANNRDQTFILVRSGKGKALINGLEYNLMTQYTDQSRSISPLPFSTIQRNSLGNCRSTYEQFHLCIYDR